MTLPTIDIYSWEITSILLLSGFLVGVVNTFAGSGTVITYSLFMMLGLPANVANGTIRMGVVMQTLTSSWEFHKKKLLDIKKGLIFSIPNTIGSLLGAQLAALTDKDIFEKIVGIVMLGMLFFIFYKPEKWIHGQASKISRKPGYMQQIIFFLLGFYGGFIHIGVGIFLLAALVLNEGYDLVKANALKVFIVFIYSPFTLLIFILNGQVHYGLGLISAIGNVIGAYFAARFAIKKGSDFIRWILVIIILVFAAHLFGIIHF